MPSHEWGPSYVGHGNRQCIHCLCTDLEANYVLGDECPVRKKKAPPKLRVIEGGLADK